jgi:hypothetical protein
MTLLAIAGSTVMSAYPVGDASRCASPSSPAPWNVSPADARVMPGTCEYALSRSHTHAAEVMPKLAGPIVSGARTRSDGSWERTTGTARRGAAE